MICQCSFMSDSIFGQQCFKILVTKMSFFITDDGPNSTESDINHYKISQFYRRKNSVGVWLEVRRWFFYRRHHRWITSVGFPFIGDSPFRRYIGRQNKKTICRWFYRWNLRANKKRFPLEIYQRIFSPSVISWFTDGY